MGRINRRRDGQLTTDGSMAGPANSFSSDMRSIMGSRKTTVEIPSSKPDEPDRTWIAADMSLDSGGDFMTGLLGFRVRDQIRKFDYDNWSWSSGPTEMKEGAFSGTVVPFSVDLRGGGRWVAFATSDRIRHSNFSTGFRAVLNNAVSELRLWPRDWDFDLVVSRSRVYEWLDENPRVFRFTRTVKFSNPGLDLDGDREEMRSLGARRKKEEFAAPKGRSLNTDSDKFRSKMDGVERGDVDIVMQARGAQGATEQKFESKETPDKIIVEDFGEDLEAGKAAVLGALKEYVFQMPD